MATQVKLLTGLTRGSAKFNAGDAPTLPDGLAERLIDRRQAVPMGRADNPADQEVQAPVQDAPEAKSDNPAPKPKKGAKSDAPPAS
ncbi:MAG: hypothetical protein AAFY65_13310 [Pseudomonadota bacterium]